MLFFTVWCYRLDRQCGGKRQKPLENFQFETCGKGQITAIKGSEKQWLLDWYCCKIFTCRGRFDSTSNVLIIELEQIASRAVDVQGRLLMEPLRISFKNKASQRFSRSSRANFKFRNRHVTNARYGVRRNHLVFWLWCLVHGYRCYYMYLWLCPTYSHMTGLVNLTLLRSSATCMLMCGNVVRFRCCVYSFRWYSSMRNCATDVCFEVATDSAVDESFCVLQECARFFEIQAVVPSHFVA